MFSRADYRYDRAYPLKLIASRTRLLAVSVVRMRAHVCLLLYTLLYFHSSRLVPVHFPMTPLLTYSFLYIARDMSVPGMNNDPYSSSFTVHYIIGLFCMVLFYKLYIVDNERCYRSTHTMHVVICRAKNCHGDSHVF